MVKSGIFRKNKKNAACLLTFGAGRQHTSVCSSKLNNMKNAILPLLLITQLTLQAQTSADADLDVSGGKLGIGPSFSDGLGAAARYYLTQRTVLEGGLYLGNTLAPQEKNDDNPAAAFNTQLGFMIDCSAHAFGKRFLKARKNRIKANGFVLRTGHQFGKFSTSMLAMGWTQEMFPAHKPNRTFIFELGLKGYLPHWNALENSLGSEFEYQEAKLRVFPFIRFHWNFFVK